MKRFSTCVVLFLTVLMLLGFTACADEELPSGAPNDPSGPSAGTEGNGAEGNEPEGNEPEGNEPVFNVQPAENEKIIQIPLTGKDDGSSYLRMVYADAEHSRLTNIFAHHIADHGECEVTEIFRSLDPNTEDDVMVLLQWYVGTGIGGHDRPTLFIFREFNSDRDGEPLAYALCFQHQFYYEKMVVNDRGDMAYWGTQKRVSVTAQVNKPWATVMQVENLLEEYEYMYLREFERTPRDYQFDLIYSCVGGEECTTVEKNLQQAVAFPWSRIRATLEK